MRRRFLGVISLIAASTLAALASAQEDGVVNNRPRDDGSPVFSKNLQLKRYVLYPGNGFESVVKDPAWASTPSHQQLASAYPAVATAPVGTGKVRCTVDNKGALRNCRTTEESPKNQGFGASFQRKVIPAFRMVPPSDPAQIAAALVVDIPFTITKAGEQLKPLTQVSWRAMPEYEDLAAALRKAGVSPAGASAVLNCTVTPSGTMRSCRAAQENRPGAGAAILSVADRFKIDLWSLDGRPTVGYRISVPINVG